MNASSGKFFCFTGKSVKTIWAILALFGVFLQEALCQQNLKRRTRLPAELLEISGLTRTPNGELWALNDSDNGSNLYRLDPATGKITKTRMLPVRNRDWEALTCDKAGNLYLGDFGNNGNARRNLRIYRFTPATGALDSILFRYPDQKDFPPASVGHWNFDCEAMIWHDDSLHLFSKNAFKGNFYTKQYILPATPGTYTAALRDSIRLKNHAVTDAAFDPVTGTLALCGYVVGRRLGFLPFTKANIVFFRRPGDTHFFKGAKKRKRLPKFLIARQFESIIQWSDTHWLLANEGIGPQKPALWRVKGARKAAGATQ
jgi:hypothetical protein